MNSREHSCKKNLGKDKLFKLKDWLTVQEAARYLSTIFGEDVSDADVFRLALDRYLKLSVLLVDNVEVSFFGRLMPFDEWEEKVRKEVSFETIDFFIDTYMGYSIQFPEYFPAALNGYDLKMFTMEFIKPRHKKKTFDETFLNSNNKHLKDETLNEVVNHIILGVKKNSEKTGGIVVYKMNCENKNSYPATGIWDLPMIGVEYCKVENEYLRISNGPPVPELFFFSAFLERDGYLWRVQKKVNDDISSESSNCYLPCELPDNIMFVVRTTALREFEERIANENCEGEKPPSRRQEKSDLHIIGAMLEIIMENDMFSSEESLRQHIADKYQGFPGCTERTLAGRFAEAKRLLSQ